MRWKENDELPATLWSLFDYVVKRYHLFAEASITAASQGQKFFQLDLGHGPFVARSMKRLEKARLHVQDEIIRSNCMDTVMAESDIMTFYLAESKMLK
jgi:hypothetical protein